MPAMDKLNKKTESIPCNEDVTQILKFLFNEDEQIESTMAHFFKVGGAMFLASIHYLVAQELLSNPKEFSMTLATADDKRCVEFKAKGDIKTMQKMFVKLCITDESLPTSTSMSSSSSSSRKRLLDELDETPTTAHHIETASVNTSYSDDDSETDVLLPPPSKRTKEQVKVPEKEKAKRSKKGKRSHKAKKPKI